MGILHGVARVHGHHESVYEMPHPDETDGGQLDAALFPSMGVIRRPPLLRRVLFAYLQRCKGVGAMPPPPWMFNWDTLPGCIFSWIALLSLSMVEEYVSSDEIDVMFFLPSCAATCTLVFFLHRTPGAQPRALFMTHFFGAAMGLSFAHLFRGIGIDKPLAELIAGMLGSCILTSMMMVTNCFQPSSCATVFIAARHNVNFGAVNDKGYLFLVTPTLLGPAIIILFGWLLNNLIPWRECYPAWL